MTTRNGYLRRSALGVFTLLGLALAGCAAPGGPGKTHEKPLYGGLRSALPVGANVVI